MRTVLWWTLALNLAVAAGKIGYGYFSDALAIRADGFHSLTDAANNIIGLVSVSLASQPPDREHPYGHHRFEALAAGLVGASLLAIAFDVIRGAAERLTGTAPALPRIDAAAFVVLIVTLVVNVAVARYERREAKRLASSFLESDAAHTHADVIVTVGVIVAAAMVKLGYIVADLVAAIAVAGETSCFSPTPRRSTRHASKGWFCAYLAWPARTRSEAAAPRGPCSWTYTSRSHLNWTSCRRTASRTL